MTYERSNRNTNNDDVENMWDSYYKRCPVIDNDVKDATMGDEEKRSDAEDEYEGMTFTRPIYISQSSRNSFADRDKKSKPSIPVNKIGKISKPFKQYVNSEAPIGGSGIDDHSIKKERMKKRKTKVSRKTEKVESLQKGNFFEYGDPVQGYKFLGSRDDYDKFQKLQKDKKDTNLTDDTITLKNDDSEETLILDYWNVTPNQLNDSSVIKTPIILEKISENNLALVAEKKLTKANIEYFYNESSKLLGRDLGILLKWERVKWHPDKLINNMKGKVAVDDALLKKVTQLFQIINELWEKSI
ncbi:uncharacterized protein NDAI_0B05230 [Naumovozyma dairenensis CBS 421]|uniref:Uncharacterized protein n=1 Tax=Naumovozyma dairenensis (strain ATCC 10597 / BCRC 20456 / CBS 421 / NBRC 0211 / NRRL Y-12639) TaxID=1071378 RepID=G0W6Z5_NAUDC|nr:hypothetical protein NDAI_0B05230 [Naumovozyma dairenensis CBS 421]CCD23556.1 hypothetical protein NDAI_0B05230 [Naumovozyma dairenensis CBS 421]